MTCAVLQEQKSDIWLANNYFFEYRLFWLQKLLYFSSILLKSMHVDDLDIAANSCSGDRSPQNLTAQISGSGAVTFVWLDPVNVVSAVEYFVSFSASSARTSVQGFLNISSVL